MKICLEGWSKINLDNEFPKHFDDFYTIPYNDVIADTYFFEKNKDFENLVENFKKIKKDYFAKYKDNPILDILNENEIMIIGSLIEKEGLNIEDKRKISSVIMNRLKKNMKLQIDASVIFAITNGKYDLERKLLFSDLKIDHPYNTYTNKGLPPKPIAYTGKKTIDIIFENIQTEFLFYFFDNSLNKHIFSKNYYEHLSRLNEYRKQ